MFNLLMQSRPWDAGHGAVSLNRLFEHTDRPLSEVFKDGDGRPLLDKLVQLPSLFMLEGFNDQLAYAGSIIRAQISGDEILIEYAFDPEIPPFLNSTIFDKKLEFRMPNRAEFSRNHWAIKDVDLYRVLLRNFQPRRQRPSVFQIPDHERIEPALISIMMPFDAAFTSVYETLRSTVEKVGLRCRRADEIWENPAIIQDVVSLIDRSRIVVCDCSGRNANVFYEIGIAHTLGREVILIAQNAADIPFDLRHLRFVPYLNNKEGRQALSAALEMRFNALLAND